MSDPTPSTNAEHAIRVLEVQTLAVSVFGDTLLAMRWMLTKTPLLGGLRPIDAAATEAGKERILTLLLRVENGVGP